MDMRHLIKGSMIALLSCIVVAHGQVKGDLASVRGKGIQYMLSCQEPGGSWMGAFGQPAMTALAALGIYGTPEYAGDAEIRAKMDKALDYVVSHAQADGSIFKSRGKGQGRGAGGYAVYNTSICLLALATYNRPKDLDVIRRARGYLMGSDAIPQASGGVPEGGFGYGSRTRSDLNNTAWALDALYVTNYLDREPFSKDPAAAKASDLAWENALKFVTICQNLQETNQSAWVASASTEDKGGFIYCPQDAMKDQPEARSLRSYGTMTYSGLKSLIYAKVKADDVRMRSAMEWVLKNYTLDENPGVGKAGIFYYFHTFSKTMSLLKLEVVTDAKGVKHDWKSELLAKLASLQRPDGSWCNEWSGRWMESIPQLSTAYCLMALQYLK